MPANSDDVILNQQAITELRRIREYLELISPHKVVRAPYVGIAAETGSAITKASAFATPTSFTFSVNTLKDTFFEVRAITGWAHENTTPADVNLFTFNIIDNSRNIKWFNSEVWANNFLPTATDPFILPAPYILPPDSLLTIEGNLYYTTQNVDIMQIVFHGYLVKLNNK